MRRLPIGTLTLTLTLTFALTLGLAGQDRGDGAAAYARLLRTHVDEAGNVDYAGLRTSADLDAFARWVGVVPKAVFEGWSRDRRLAFLVNAYNGLTLKLIAERYPDGVTRDGRRSIRNLEKPWDGVRFRVLGDGVTLDHLEHEVIRKRWNDPRIHMALVCAARGCPILWNRPYTGVDLTEQLDAASRRYLASPAGIRVDPERGVVHLSMIFNWYKDDWQKADPSGEGFADRRGAEGAVLRFVLRHAPAEHREWIAGGEFRVRHLEYDWTLNER